MEEVEDFSAAVAVTVVVVAAVVAVDVAVAVGDNWLNNSLPDEG